MTGVLDLPIKEPRLRLVPVFVRGLAHGGVALVVVFAWTMRLDDHQDRLDVLGPVSGAAMILAIVGLAVGGFWWWCAKPDVMRWRDWRLVTGRFGAVAIWGPALIRIGAAALVVSVGGFVLYQAVDNADFDSWLYD